MFRKFWLMADTKKKDLSTVNTETEEMMEDDVVIDIEAMTRYSEEGFLSPWCCIYKVPDSIRKLKQDDYTPKILSIGPFHYGSESLQNMEKLKQVFFKSFIQQAMTSSDDLVSFAKHSEPRVRGSYSEKIRLSKNELVKVMLVDAGFIVELFMKRFYRKPWFGNDAERSKPWLEDTLRVDLILLENQLPFFFLQELFNRAFPPYCRGNIPSFLELTYFFFSYFNIQKLNPNLDAANTIKHFTDLLRFFHLQGQKPESHWLKEVRNHVLSCSANELNEAGVRFKASTSKCLLDLKFSGRVLEVPQIFVEDITEVLFRNMIALEQCHYPYESYITDYAFVLDSLINTNKDVDVLINGEIIRNYLEDTDGVAKLFNGLCINTIQWKFNSDYLDIWKRLNEFYQDPWHKRKAALRLDYCKTPWQTAASVAGIIVLILSVVQTITSILQVVK